VPDAEATLKFYGDCRVRPQRVVYVSSFTRSERNGRHDRTDPDPPGRQAVALFKSLRDVFTAFTKDAQDLLKDLFVANNDVLSAQHETRDRDVSA
jgi:hypothetical protein